MRSEDERAIALFCHLSSLLWLPLLVVGFPIPLANIIIPLLVWSLQRERSPFVDRHGRESVNFQLSMLVYSFVLFIVAILLGVLLLSLFGLESFLGSSPSPSPTAIYGFIVVAMGYGIFVIVWSIVQLILVIWAAIWAYRGRDFRYPLTLRFLAAPVRDRE